MKTLLFFLTAVLSLFPLKDTGHYFRQANDYYKNKQYADAYKIYKDLLDEDISSPALYYNLGNTCLKLYKNKQVPGGEGGYLARTILYYENGLLLAPDDPDLRHNLTYANIFTVDKIENEEEANPLLKAVFFFYFFASYKTQGYWALAFFSLFVLALLTFLVLPAARRLWVLKLALVPLVLYLVLLVSSLLKYRELKGRREGIIREQVVDMKTEPQEDSNTAAKVHEGTKIYIRRSDGPWYYVYLKNGFNGWIREDSFYKILTH